MRAIGAEIVVAGEGFRFGRGEAATSACSSSSAPRSARRRSSPASRRRRIRALLGDGDVRAAAELLGRPAEVEGIVVSGDARGGTLGFPTANLRVDRAVLVPGYGIYAGSALDHRAAVSIGVNPHYGGAERRVEAFLLDFEGDLYNRRVVVELWDRLRDEAVFGSEAGADRPDRPRRRADAAVDATRRVSGAAHRKLRPRFLPLRSVLP